MTSSCSSKGAALKYVNIVIDNKSNSTDSLFTYACADSSVRVGSKVRVLGAGRKTRIELDK